MREVTYRTYPDGTLVVEVITRSCPIVPMEVIEPDKVVAAV
ncbi:hypothetical protein [Arthrobacter terrae]|nr:hypothetical protein [Arthrobacter terrae]